MGKQYLIVALVVLVSCTPKIQEDRRQMWLDEIQSTEKAFSQMSNDEGIRSAFLAYAADDVVLLRGEKLIHGKDGIGQYYRDGPRDTTVNLTWSPDFIDVSTSGDLGYTYGQYVYMYRDSSGQRTQSTGYFHTVWKRQEDGSWKFVWD